MVTITPPPMPRFTPPTIPPDFRLIPPAGFYTPPTYTYSGTPVNTINCCDTTWLYMLVAGMIGGIIGYAIHTQRKVK